MIMKEIYEFSNLKSDDLNSLTGLFVLVWNQDRFEVKEKTEWAFNNSFSKVIVARNQENQLIGARGGIEWPLMLQDKELNCYQLHGTCVHPNYRRKGLFSTLNKEFLKGAQHDGYDLIFNVSVIASRLGYEKLGWKYLKGFHRLTKVHLMNYSKNYSSNENLIEDTESIIIPEAFYSARELQFKNLIHTRYDEHFLKWRLSNKSENYKLYETDNAIIIYKTKIKNDKKEMIIGEVFLRTGKYSEFSQSMRNLIKTEKPFISYTYIFENHPFYKFFIRYFFLPNPFNYHLNFGTRSLSNKYSLEDYKWGVSFLDIDTF